MGKRIYNFESYVNESYGIYEAGFFSKVKSFVEKWVTKPLRGWAESFYAALVSNKIRTIENGPYKGYPVAMLFLSENGPIDQQVKDFYGDPKNKVTSESIDQDDNFAKNSELDEAKVPLEWTGEAGEVLDVFADEIREEVIFLKKTKESGGRGKPIFIFGAPGVGKSEIIEQVASELNCALLRLPVSMMLPEDFMGIPSKIDIEEPEIQNGVVVNPGRGYTRSNPPRVLPTDDCPNGNGGIIFMDELNRADPYLLPKLNVFIQTGEIGDYKIPSNKWVFVAAGNRPSDGDVAEPDASFFDRFSVVNYVPTVQRWSEWATKKGLMSELIQWMSYSETHGDFHNLDSEKKVLNFPTPRAWTDAALILRDWMKYNDIEDWRDMPIEKINRIFYKEVGPSAASKFTEYLALLKDMTDADMDKCLLDPESVPLVKTAGNVSVLYALGSILIGRAGEYGEDCARKLLNILKYIKRYDKSEVLAFVYNKIRNTYKDFGNALSGDEDSELRKIKVEAAELVGRAATAGLSK